MLVAIASLPTLRELADEAPADVGGVRRRRDLGREHDELVAAHARHGVHRTQRGGEGAGHPAQERVAGRVALRVVDVLEAVEVDEQHRDGPDRAGRCRQRAVDAVDEHRSVRKPGQRVVGGLLGQRRLGGLQLDQAVGLGLPSLAISRCWTFCTLRSVNVRHVSRSPSWSSGELPTRTGIAAPVRSRSSISTIDA
jgi:hypothetical protein